MTERTQGQAALRSQDLRAEPRLTAAALMPPRPSPLPPIGGPKAAPPQAGHIAGLQATGPGLLRSTLKAGGVAAAILVVFTLPAEYGVDPTGIGGLLGLTEMGQIKQQLYAEAEAEDAAAAASNAPPAVALPADLAGRLGRIEEQVAAIAAVVGAGAPIAAGLAPAPAEPLADGGVPEAPLAPEAALAEVASLDGEAPPREPVAPVASAWRDEASLTLAPGEGIEIKLAMQEGEVATFEWSANGGVLNHATHGDGGGQEVSYEDGRAVPGQTGELTAAFTGNHGWFWRNRTEEPVTLTLRTGGEYEAMLR